MDVFQGNQKLEEAIFSGMDYALYSRHDLEVPFVPFMMLYKNGQSKLVRVAVEGNPLEAFSSTLRNDDEQYDQIIMCLEGKVPFEETKHDAIIVKGYDTSSPNGIMFIQRFKGLELGEPFQKLGNPTLVSKEEPLPVQLIKRDTFKEIDQPYLSGISRVNGDKQIIKELFAGHYNASTLSNHLFEVVLDIFEAADNDFSGEIIINIIPNSIEENAFSDFIFSLLVSDIRENPIIKGWEIASGNIALIDIKYVIESADDKVNTITNINDNKAATAWWKFW
ncbi:hypothetical protein [Flammeovirga pacifica]|uniref:Uncharacterized protein n=1 Tax=Flammeovirga pacifica TaxID=915059 RepID=A0A1S1YU28_FLAPC|nr:hypothetical protein [Flammeovirga pacifica]OHX64542.1 hypothetical protein NH26_23500 [Flammeovirga pacifica]